MISRKTMAGVSLTSAILFLPFSIPLCHASLALFFACWVVEGRWREKAAMLTKNSGVFAWAYVLFFILHLCSLLYTDDVANGWFNLEKKITLLLLPLAISTTGDLDQKTVRLMFRSFIIACLAGTVVCLVMAFRSYNLALQQSNFDFLSLSLYETLNPSANPGWMFFSYIELAGGIKMHPTFLAMYLLFSLLLLVHLYVPSFPALSRWSKAGLVLLALYLAVFIVLLSSRTVALVMLVLLFAGIYRLGSRYVLPATAVLAAFVLMATIDPVHRYRSLQEPFVASSYLPDDNGSFNFSTGIRKSLWHLGLLAVSDVNPLVGTGAGDVEHTLKQIGEERGITNSINSFDPHNEFIFIQVGLGALGLLSLLACLLLPAWPAFTGNKYLYLGFAFLFASVCMTESALESQKGIVFFAIFNSILVFQYFRLEPVLPKRFIYG